MSETSSIIGLIKKAWSNSTYTAEIHAELDLDTGHPEDKEARQLFVNRKWHEIPADVLLAKCPSPFLIGNEPLCYYLPAFLITALSNPEEMLMEFLIEFELQPPKKRAPYEWFCKRFESLTAEQASAVAQFLVFCKEEHISYPRTLRRIDDALERYWQNPEIPRK